MIIQLYDPLKSPARMRLLKIGRIAQVPGDLAQDMDRNKDSGPRCVVAFIGRLCFFPFLHVLLGAGGPQGVGQVVVSYTEKQRIVDWVDTAVEPYDMPEADLLEL